MNLIEVRKDSHGELPFTTNTIYKFHSTKRYPSMILKVGGKLFFDMTAWEELVEESRDRAVETAKQVRQVKR